jgi:hypothetical protein
MLDHSTYNMQFYRPSLPDTDGPQTDLHEQVHQLGQLATYIALDLNSASRLKAEQARLRMECLNKWHRTLPSPMQLSWLGLDSQQGIPAPTKRSLLQLHMLFLGFFTEPWRMLLVDLGNFRLSDTSRKPENLEDMQNIEKQCILGAQQCARVAALLQVDNLVRSHCWVAV